MFNAPDQETPQYRCPFHKLLVSSCEFKGNWFYFPKAGNMFFTLSSLIFDFQINIGPVWSLYL
jgi:hypothetical protein